MNSFHMNLDHTFKNYEAQRKALEEKGSMNQSGLSQLKIALCRQRFPPTNATFFNSGTAVHERKLQNRYKHSFELSVEDERDVEGMCGTLNRCTELDALLFRSSREQFVSGLVHGYPMHGTLDIHNTFLPAIGDIKTTSTKTNAEFIKSARKYGYFRQAFVYCTITGIKRFVFFGVRKHPPYEVFIIDTIHYPKDMAYAKQEVKFLLELNALMRAS